MEDEDELKEAAGAALGMPAPRVSQPNPAGREQAAYQRERLSAATPADRDVLMRALMERQRHPVPSATVRPEAPPQRATLPDDSASVNVRSPRAGSFMSADVARMMLAGASPEDRPAVLRYLRGIQENPQSADDAQRRALDSMRGR